MLVLESMGMMEDGREMATAKSEELRPGNRVLKSIVDTRSRRGVKARIPGVENIERSGLYREYQQAFYMPDTASIECVA